MKKIKFKTDDVFCIHIIRCESKPHEKVEILLKKGKIISALYYENGVKSCLPNCFPLETDFFKMPKKSEIVFSKGTKNYVYIGREEYRENLDVHMENNEVQKCWHERRGYSTTVGDEFDSNWISFIF